MTYGNGGGGGRKNGGGTRKSFDGGMYRKSPTVNEKTGMGKPAGDKCVSPLSGGVKPYGAGKRGGRKTA